MKKFIFCTLLLSFIFSSCGSDSDDDRVYVKDIDVNINVGETYSLDKGDYMIESVSDEFIAEASVDGTVKGMHAGNALVVMKGKGYTYNLNVTVDSKNTFFTDLKVYMGATKDEIKEELGTPETMSNDGKYFYYTKKSDGLMTAFSFNDKDKVEFSLISFNVIYADKVTKHLTDRYLYMGESNGTFAFMDAYDIDDLKTFVALKVESRQLTVSYMSHEALNKSSNKSFLETLNSFK